MEYPNSRSTTLLSIPFGKTPKGFLREDLLVLCHIFDFNHGPNSLTKDRLQALGGLEVNISGPQFKDLLLVGVVIENPDAAQLKREGTTKSEPPYSTRDIYTQ